MTVYTALKTKLLIILFAVCTLQATAWDWWPLPMAEPDTCHDMLLYTGELSALSSSGKTAPTWMQANRNGEVSSLPHSGNLSLGIVKPATRPNRWFDYDGAVVLSGRVSGMQSGDPRHIEGTGFFRALYAHTRLYIIDITVGIQPQVFGTGDPELSSGGLLFSANAHPIPRISVGIDRWTAFPGLFGYLEIKCGLTHGWLADNYPDVRRTLLHHKYIGGRLGGKLPVNISYEFHHAAQWGGYSDLYGDLGNDWTAFRSTLLVKSGGTMRNDQINAQGNHIGYQQMAIDVKGKGWKVSAYWQIIQEDGPIRFIGFGMNNKDGLWGVSASQSIWPFVQGVTYEFLNTTDQSGPFHDRDGCVYGGRDSYYQNSIYRQGWTYFGRVIGSPLLSPDDSRVMAHHIGLKGDIYGFRYRALCTYSDHYGTYSAPLKSHNTSWLVEVKKTVPQAWGLEFGIALAGDHGNLYGNQFGGMVTVRKQGIIKSW